jgi:hypothetical protein
MMCKPCEAYRLSSSEWTVLTHLDFVFISAQGRTDGKEEKGQKIRKRRQRRQYRNKRKKAERE